MESETTHPRLFTYVLGPNETGNIGAPTSPPVPPPTQAALALTQQTVLENTKVKQ